MPSSRSLNAKATEQLKQLIDNVNLAEGISEPIKNQAMEYVEQGAQAGTKGNSAPYTLLHLLVLTNVKGCHTEEIEQLLNDDKDGDLIDIKGDRGLTPLGSLIYSFLDKKQTLEDFKETAMLLARNKASLKARYNDQTVLHILVLNNENGINDTEILELLTLDSELINYSQHSTPLAFLIDHSVHKHCTEKSFGDTAKLLVENGADPKRRGRLTGVSLFHQFLFTNQLTEAENLIENDPSIMQQPHVEYLLNRWITGTIKLEAFKTSLAFLKEHEVYLFAKVGTTPTTVLHVLVASNEGHINDKEIMELLEDEPTLINYPPEHTALASLIDHTAIDFETKGQSHLSDFRATLGILAEFGADLTVKGPKSAYTLLEFLLDTNVDGSNDTEIVQLLKLNQELYIEPLLKAIKFMHNYGVKLDRTKAPKGRVVMQLAEDLKSTINSLLSGAISYSEFKQSFPTTLISKDEEMSEYRVNWATVMANFAIALTGVGILFIVGHLAATYYGEEHRALFFFQEKKTTSELYLGAVKDQAALLQIY